MKTGNSIMAAPSLISISRHKINKYLINELKKSGVDNISPSHGDILYSLYNNKELTMSDMAKLINRDPSTVTTLVNKLKNKGYIELIENKDDLRSKFIRLTIKGQELEIEFIRISNDVIKTMFTDIDKFDQETFVNVLVKIINNLSN